VDGTDEQHRQDRGDDGDGEQGSDLVVQEFVEAEGGSDDAAGGVGGPVEPEDAAPGGGVGVDHE